MIFFSDFFINPPPPTPVVGWFVSMVDRPSIFSDLNRKQIVRKQESQNINKLCVDFKTVIIPGIQVLVNQHSRSRL